MINLPLSSMNVQTIYKIFVENIGKLKNFFNKIINPLNISKIIQDINKLTKDSKIE